MTRKTIRSAAARTTSARAFEVRFDYVTVRPRRDGWTPARQVRFIEALAECGCVAEACARVGMTDTAAYALRRRVDAGSFRTAWDAALDHAVKRLSDAVFARAIHGVAQPVFYRGEQVGERRRYDERLAMFVLRYRDPVRYGRWNDDCRAERHPDGAAIQLEQALLATACDAQRILSGLPARVRGPDVTPRFAAAAEAGSDSPDLAAKADLLARWEAAKQEWKSRS